MYTLPAVVVQLPAFNTPEPLGATPPAPFGPGATIESVVSAPMVPLPMTKPWLVTVVEGTLAPSRRRTLQHAVLTSVPLNVLVPPIFVSPPVIEIVPLPAKP